MKNLLLILLLFLPGTVLAQDNVGDAAQRAVENAAGEAAAGIDGDVIVVEAAQVGRAIMVGGASMSQLVAAKRFHLNQIFAVEIAEISRLCELDPGQVKKLTVGAKGAVKKLLEEWKKKSAAMPFGVFQDALDAQDGKEDANNAAEVPEEVEISDAGQIDEMSMQMLEIGAGENPFATEQPTRHEFWKKTLASVLSESQATRLDQYRSERQQKKCEAMVILCMNTLNLELGLDEGQYGKLSALIAPRMASAQVECFSFMEPYLYYYHASKVDEKDLKEFLSHAQLQKWKFFMSPSKQIGEMIEMEAQGMGVIEVQGKPVETDDD